MNNFSQFGEDFQLYMQYFTKMSVLKHSFHILDISKKNNTNWNKADCKVGQLEFRYLWKDIYIATFKEFIENKDWNGIDYWKKRKPIKMGSITTV